MPIKTAEQEYAYVCEKLNIENIFQSPNILLAAINFDAFAQTHCSN